ncbi:D-aminoacylase [Candidatus Bathyarchaeota archaeon]|nr:D-aminoacylase [Candidatus Bathyarchaeota archaeon]
MFDLIIKDGFVVDGTGNPWVKTDVGVKTGKIVKVGRINKAEGDRVIDASGLIVCPGFIDIHDHSEFHILANPQAESKVRQGVTTQLNGNCGSSAAPLIGEALEQARKTAEPIGVKVDWSTLAEYNAKLERQGVAINVASLVGYNTVRLGVMGYEDRPPSEEELEEMKRIVAQAMEDGAFGMSTGLDKGLVPGCFTTTEELIEVARVVAKYGGFYASHIRNRQERIIEAAKEAIRIGEEAGIPVQISHYNPRYPDDDKMPECLKLLDEARRRGIDVTCDAIPPTLENGWHWAVGVLATQVLPNWAYEGGLEKTLERLRDPKTREKMKKDNDPLWGVCKEGRWDRVKILQCEKNPELRGKTIQEIAEMKGVDPLDAAYDILLAEGKGLTKVYILGTSTREETVYQVLKHPACSIQSDRRVHAPYGPLAKVMTEPLAYGCFPRAIQLLVKEKKLLTLEDAIRKMTSLSARRMELRDRGLLREGFWADITIFDFKRIRERGTLEKPAQYPEGIEYVIVNGEIVVDKGEHTGKLPGKVLRKNVNAAR